METFMPPQSGMFAAGGSVNTLRLHYLRLEQYSNAFFRKKISNNFELLFPQSENARGVFL
jgi:hypothetical protein